MKNIGFLRAKLALIFSHRNLALKGVDDRDPETVLSHVALIKKYANEIEEELKHEEKMPKMQV